MMTAAASISATSMKATRTASQSRDNRRGTDTTRARQGVSIQAVPNGYFSDVPTTILVDSPTTYTDPLDSSAFKKIRITVNGTNDTFEVRVIGWDTRLGAPDWNPSYENVLTFTDSAVAAGRIGVGS